MVKPELPELLLPDRAAWRAWLEENHEESPGVHVVIHKKGGNVTDLTYDDAVEEALCFGWIDGQAWRRDEGSYLQRMTRRGSRSNWAQSNVARVARLQAEGLMRPAGLAAVEAAKQDGRWPEP
jgi:uncharacterized protein YdeI (YjbR/CyaY-like superfamily)